MDEVFSKERMLNEANLLDATVEFLIKQVDEQIYLLEQAARAQNQVELEKHAKSLKTLLARLAKEDKNMEDFLTSYDRIVTNEKKKVLFVVGQKEQEALRFISQNERGTCSGQIPQGQVTGRR